MGANRGQFSLLIHYLYPKNKIIAYEPLKSEFSILKNIFKSHEEYNGSLFSEYELIGMSNYMFKKSKQKAEKN